MKRYTWQPPSAAIPTAPGVYRFLTNQDPTGAVLYVGKAKNLRARLTSYFQEPNQLEPRTATMVQQAGQVIWTVVNTEAEALQLEHSLINQFKPKYNIRFRDDKSYPYLCITAKDEYPRIFSTRRKTIPGARYFGPYPNPSDVRFAIDSLLKIYPVRSCSNGVFRNHQKQGRACLLGHIDKCSAPCTKAISKEEHHQVVEQLTNFLSGGHGEVIQSLDSRMAKASAEERFEDAAKLRDQGLAVEAILQKSAVSIERDLCADFIGIVSSELNSVISLVEVRNGRVTGEQRFHADVYSQMTNLDILSEFVLTRYSDANSEINEIYLAGIEADITDLNSALNLISKFPYRLHIPLRGEKARIAALTLENAKSAIDLQSKTVLADLNSRSQALQDLAIELNLAAPPLRIECVDVSHLQGSNRVGAVVVFEDGLPARSEYRSYVLQNPGDDLAGIREIIARRIPRFLETGSRYPVGLLVIDGGPWQAQAAAEVLKAYGLEIPTVGLAKRLEEVWLPAGKIPIMLPRNSGALYLLQQLRDETHRRAIRHHRMRRSKASVQSVLDEIEGVGPQKRKLLLKTFGGARGLRAAKTSDIANLPGIGPILANKIYAKLHLEELNLSESEPSKVSE
jgi:excinuclease ABC subunit C